jgi:two-component system cell cycle sensor histidine kinase/response regulator CckA
VGENISQRKRAEEALRRSEEGYRSLFEGAPYGLYRSTVDGKPLMANPALFTMLGYKSETELLNSRSAAEFFRETARQNFRVGHSQAHKLSLFAEVPCRRKDGTEILLSVRCRPLFNGLSTPQWIEGTIEDVTQQRILEEQLLQSRKMEAIALMAGGIAHDFNALLMAVLGYSERLVMARDLPENHRREAEEIVQAALQARTLTQQLLALGRRQVLQPKPLDLNSLLSESRHLLEGLMGSGIELHYLLDSHLLSVKADPGQLTQVIINLAINARDAMTEGGRLTVTTENVELKPENSPFAGLAADKYVSLKVSDTGCGMDKATQERIFEPFFTTKPQGKGTGLGLSTVHGIIEQSGGQISVSSKFGQGTSFRILLPVMTEPPEVQSPKELQKESLTGLETILVVEDSDLTRKLTCENLQENGYEVLSARNAQEAGDIARSHRGPIHLLLTDVVMPGMSGERLARMLASRRPETKVLYMTGYVEAMSAPVSKKDSAQNILQKPFLAHELMGKVREILGDGGKDRTRFVH